MAELVIDRVGKRYGSGAEALREVSLEVAQGELLVLVGPSGCGKSTLLRLVAGLEAITSGEIRIGGRRVNEAPPAERDIAMVFQDYALYPHMTVRRNLEFGLRMRRRPKSEIAARVGEVARLLELEPLLERKPAQLSGGQRQRVAIGRAIVRQPAVFLFDEPLSNLDAQLRAQTRVELASLHRRLGSTSVYVTHDQVEAMTLADRIVVLEQGRVQQVGTPLELYRKPANRFVAGFIGTPRMNFVEGVVEEGSFRFPGGELPAAAAPVSGRVVLGLRPEALRPGEGRFAGTLRLVEHHGHEAHLVLDGFGAEPVVARYAGDPRAFRAGERIPLDVDPEGLHWFDAESGRALGGPA